MPATVCNPVPPTVPRIHPNPTVTLNIPADAAP